MEHENLQRIVYVFNNIMRSVEQDSTIFENDFNRKNFIQNIIKFFDIPKRYFLMRIELADTENDLAGAHGYGMFRQTSLMVSKKYFRDLDNLSKRGEVESIFIELLNTICHELTHAEQYWVLAGEYGEDFKDNFLADADEFLKKTLTSAYDFKVEKIKVEEMRDVAKLLHKYDDEFEDLEMFDDSQVKSILEMYYYSRESEVSARAGAIRKTAQLIKSVYESDMSSPQLKHWIETNVFSAFLKSCEKEKKLIENTEKMSKILKQIIPDLGIDKLLDIDRNIVFDNILEMQTSDVEKAAKKDLRDASAFKNLLRIRFRSIFSDANKLEILAKICQDGSVNFVEALIDAMGEYWNYMINKKDCKELENKFCEIMKKGEFFDARTIYTLISRMPLQKESLFDIVKEYVKNDKFEYVGLIVKGLLDVRTGKNENVDWGRIGDNDCKLEREILPYVYREASARLKKLSKKKELTAEEKLLIESLSLLYSYGEQDSDILKCLTERCGVREKNYKKFQQIQQYLAQNISYLEPYELVECSREFEENPQLSYQYYIDMKILDKKRIVEEKIYGKKYAEFNYKKGVAQIELEEKQRKKKAITQEMDELKKGEEIMKRGIPKIAHVKGGKSRKVNQHNVVSNNQNSSTISDSTSSL